MASSSDDKCPIDHKALAAAQPDKCPVDHGAHGSPAASTSSGAEQCPVDHTARSSWTSMFSSKKDMPPPISAASVSHTTGLPTERETSSIPRTDGSKWVYPSQAQFYAAMERKNHSPQAQDMRVIVPIHNAVNERAWAEILKWEAGQGGEKCGGVKLVSFKGRPQERTPKARWLSLLGYTPPFDRHDWVIDRCGTRTRYVIDFYTGRAGINSNISFYLDVRPALDNWEGFRLRAGRLWDETVGSLWGSSPSPKST